MEGRRTVQPGSPRSAERERRQPMVERRLAAAYHAAPVRELILGIETSCDETAAAVVEAGTRVLSNVVHSQTALHERWRGVVPEVASRSHTERILPIVQQALADAQLTPPDLTAIAVTHRPGMIGCLLVGLAAAKALAWRFGKPLLGVDHVQAHVHTGFLAEPDLPLPALALVASGGHTALYLIHERGRTERLGTTRDDAAGEALDKGAALLGLPYPGGPAIQRAAATGDAKRYVLPRTLLGPDSLDFSFSGLKTALLYTLRPQGAPPRAAPPEGQELADLAASYQEALVDVLVQKLARAARATSARSLCLGGGVARNTRLRERLAAEPGLAQLHLVLPAPDLCSDNGAMIASLGSHLWRTGQVATLELDAVATPAAGGKAKAR